MNRFCKTLCVFLFFPVLFVSLTVFLFPGEKKPFSIDDLYRVKNISTPKLSPDGKKLLFSVTEYNMQKGSSNSDIYLMNLGDNKLLRLTFDKKSDSDPYWSADGQRIYFLSSRDGGNQLWVMDANGGEAKKLSDFYAELSSPLPINNSNKVLFSAYVYPECRENPDCNKCNKDLDDKLSAGPVKAHLADSLLFRHWTSYRDWKYNHLFCFDPDKPAKDSITPITKGSVDFPAYSSGGGGYDISPDGKLICTTSNYDKDAASSTNSDLFLIDMASSERIPVNITADNKAFDGEPAFAPDGSSIAFVRQKIPGYESDLRQLALYNINTKQVKILTEPIDNWVEDFEWSPDSRYIYFTISEKGYEPLYRVNLKTYQIEPVIERQVIRGFQITPDGKKVILKRSSVGEPYEIWSYEIGKTGSLKRLTFFNKPVEDEIDFRPAEEMWVEGAEGKKIQIFVVKPHGFDPNKKYPLILNVHGGPQSQWADSFRGDWQVYPGCGYIVAFPNPHGSTGFGQAFTNAIAADWNGRVMEDIDKVTRHLAGLPYIDAERMGAMGWSWGGYAMMWLEGHNKHFKALASMMGIYDARIMYSGTEELWFPEWDFGGKPWDKPDYYREVSAASYVKEFKTPCLIITGEKDYRVAYINSVEFFTDLQEMNVDSRLIIFTDDGHWPNHVKSMPVYYNAHLEWFHKYLKGDKAPYDTEKMIRNLAYEEKSPDGK